MNRLNYRVSLIACLLGAGTACSAESLSLCEGTECDELQIKEDTGLGVIRQASGGTTEGPTKPTNVTCTNGICYSSYTWNAGQPTVQMRNASTNLCVLTSVRGEFRGAGETARVFVDENGVWMLTGTSGRSGGGGVGADAMCVPRSHFVGPSGSVNWVSEEGRLAFRAETSGILSQVCKADIRSMWWGDAATMIAGMSGRFMGTPESILVTQSSDAFGASIVSAISCQDGAHIEINARSFFVGVPGAGRLATFVGPSGTGPDVAVGRWTINTGTNHKDLPRVDRAVCYFTKINGRFNADKTVNLTHVTNAQGERIWRLSRSGSGSGNAEARCMAFDQR